MRGFKVIWEGFGVVERKFRELGFIMVMMMIVIFYYCYFYD